MRITTGWLSFSCPKINKIWSQLLLHCRLAKIVGQQYGVKTARGVTFPLLRPAPHCGGESGADISTFLFLRRQWEMDGQIVCLGGQLPTRGHECCVLLFLQYVSKCKLIWGPG